jgi:hypothetical protein
MMRILLLTILTLISGTAFAYSLPQAAEVSNTDIIGPATWAGPASAGTEWCCATTLPGTASCSWRTSLDR